jgi:hypothetical protein
MDFIPADANAWDDDALRHIRAIAAGMIAAAVAMTLASRPALADGGALQFQQQASGYVISLFGSPAPLRVGPADLSVMVQDVKQHATILNAHVVVHVSTVVSHEIREVVVPATRTQASNKLLYATSLTFPSPGDWNATVDVAVNGETVSVSGKLHVLPERAPLAEFWPFFLAIPVLIALFSLNQWLKGRRRMKNPGALP